VEPVRFRTSDGLSLEGELRRPDGPPRGGAVICHAHPRFGGSKDFPLLWAIRNALAQCGFVVLAFNFRGTMGSEGEHGGGVDEIEDARAAIIRVREEAEGATFVAGWSFGASVALREAMDDERVGALALVGIPLGRPKVPTPPLPGPEALGAFDRPVLLVAGDRDEHCPASALRALGDSLGRAEVLIVPGVDHYFLKREREVAGPIATFAERTVGSIG